MWEYRAPLFDPCQALIRVNQLCTCVLQHNRCAAEKEVANSSIGCVNFRLHENNRRAQSAFGVRKRKLPVTAVMQDRGGFPRRGEAGAGPGRWKRVARNGWLKRGAHTIDSLRLEVAGYREYRGGSSCGSRGVFAPGFSVGWDRLQPEGVFARGDHDQRDWSAIRFAVQVFCL
jgi:hypothetical protein